LCLLLRRPESPSSAVNPKGKRWVSAWGGAVATPLALPVSSGMKELPQPFGVRFLT